MPLTSAAPHTSHAAATSGAHADPAPTATATSAGTTPAPEVTWTAEGCSDVTTTPSAW